MIQKSAELGMDMKNKETRGKKQQHKKSRETKKPDY